MSRILLSLIIVLLLITSAFPQTTPVYNLREKMPDTKAFTNAKIIISPDLTYEKATLVIKNGKIEAVGENISIPPEATITDLTGYTIYPGFIEAFSNYGLTEAPKPKRSRDRKESATRIGCNAANDAVHSHHSWDCEFIPDTKKSEEFFKAGFTVVQSSKLDGIFRGQSFIALLGDGLPNDKMLKLKSHHFLSFNKGNSQQEYPSSTMGSIALIRQMFYDIDWYKKAHKAYIANPNQKAPEINNSIEALANYKNMTFIFEPEDELTLFQADNVAREFDLDMIYLGSGYEYTRIDDIKNRGISLILPLNYPKAPEIKSFEDELDVNLSKLRHWEMAPVNPSILEKNNISFALTTYHLDEKSSILTNIKEAIKYGLSERQALRSLTTIPANICQISDICGTLEKGKLANFFVTDGNIFEDDIKIYSVWVSGSENILTERPKVDFSGTYSLTFNDFESYLILEGKLPKLSGKIIYGEDTVALKNVSSSMEKLFFSFELDTLDYYGINQLSGYKKDSSLSGYGSLADGNIFNWNASPAELPEPEKSDDSTKTSDDEATDEDDKTDAKEDEPPQIVSNLTFPNKAFGFKTIPKMENVLIKNATIWTSEDAGILENSDLLITNGKIVGVGKNLELPKNHNTIDATGKHITAGIIDAHSHLAIYGGVNECTEAITAEVRIGDVVNPNDINIYRQLSGGVTSSHLLHGSCNPIGGQAQLIKLRWGSSAEEMKFESAYPTIKFALGENIKRSNWGREERTRYPISRLGIESIIDDELQTAKEYEQNWNDYNSLSKKQKNKTIPPRKDLELDAVVDVLNMDRLIHCHSYVHTEILMLMRLAEKYDFRIRTFTHILGGYKVADEMAKHGATASSFSDWWAYKFEVYDAIPYNISLMTEKGVNSSVNSDNADLARRLNQESAKSVLYGDMPILEAIKLATINPAIQLKVDDRVGSLKPGKDADFVIWNDNPLSIYAKVEQTWIDGAKYFDIESDKLLREENSVEKQALIQKVLRAEKTERPDADKPIQASDMEWHCDDNIDFWRMINDAK